MMDQRYGGMRGFYLTGPYGVLEFIPLGITGEIVSYAFELDGDGQRHPWGMTLPLGTHRIRLYVSVRYHAGGAYHTGVNATVYAPSGISYSGSDTDAWPYESPETSFWLSPGAFDITEPGVWEAGLEYYQVGGAALNTVGRRKLLEAITVAEFRNMAITQFGKY